MVDATTLPSGTTLPLALVTILIDTMKFSTSVIAVALAAAAPSVLGTSAGVNLSRIFNRFANVCRVGAGSAIRSS